MERNFKEHFRALQIIYLGLFMGMFLFAFVVYFVLKPERTEGLEFFNLVVPIFSMLALAGSFIAFKYLLEKALKEKDFETKFNQYRLAIITRGAIWEGTVLFATVIYLLSGNINLLIIAIVFIVLFLFNTPTISKFIADLEMSGEEAQKLHDENFKF